MDCAPKPTSTRVQFNTAPSALSAASSVGQRRNATGSFLAKGGETNQLENKSWVLCRDIAGLFNQSTGLAQAVSQQHQHYPTQLRFPWRRLPLALIPVWKNVLAEPQFLNDSPPRLVLSGGRHGVIPSLYLKKKYGDRVFTVHIQDPTIDPKRFDLVVAPAHDFVRGDNVVLTNGAIHHLNKAKLIAAENTPRATKLTEGGRRVVAVLLGGPNKYYRFSDADASAFTECLKSAAAQDPAIRLAILPSRRTPERLFRSVLAEFSEQHFVWNREGDNPYLPALAVADAIVVTGDSVSMISEATITGRPIHVFPLTETRTARRFRRFHKQFEEQGFTRRFTGELQQWHYEIPNDTQRVAEEIGRGLRAKEI